MARTPARHRLTAAFPWRVGAPLTVAERTRTSKRLSELLGWQRRLGGWPEGGRGFSDGTPFVSLYAAGRLTGCYGSDEGSGGDRLARAFLRALEDTRFGPVTPEERGSLAAQVSYPVRPRELAARKAPEVLEPGTHGVALVHEGRPAVVLLPHVARDRGLGAREILEVLADKAGLPRDAWRDARLFVFETQDVVGRGTNETVRTQSPRAEAIRWLASTLQADGTVTFAIDGRRRVVHRVGPMHHGRTAVVVQALARAQPSDPRVARLVARARQRLVKDILAGLAGERIEAFPEHPALVAGTCALACLAGAPLQRELVAWMNDRPEVRDNAWHLGQIGLALGNQMPASLWEVAVRDLDRQPWAPWTLLAARKRGERAVAARCEAAIVASIRRAPPYEGGAGVTPVPELALTAIAAEALATSTARAAQSALARARRFLLHWQHPTVTLRAALDSDMVGGAFPASPIADLARGDVTAHALLALETR